MILNEHVNAATVGAFVRFTPYDGYALWRDDDTGNLDENGDPIHFYLQIGIPRYKAETLSSHIWARLIEEGMQVYGNTQPVVKE